MGISLLTDFHSKFIQLASNFEYTSKMLNQKFKHKLTRRSEDQYNFEIELLILILTLAEFCLSIYK